MEEKKILDTLTTVHVINDNRTEGTYYRILPEDVLAIRNLQDVNFGNQTDQGSGSTLQTKFVVQADGSVNLPVIGKVQVAGLTRKDAENLVQDLYGNGPLKNPIIELSIVNLYVTVLGEFQKQGNFLLEKESTSLIDIIGEAGGLTQRANPRTLKIIRGDRKSPEIIYVNLNNINSLTSNKLTVRNDDIIYAEPRRIYSSREGVQSATSIIQPIFTLLNLALIIYNFSK